MVVTVLSRQSLLDLAVQTSGSAEAAFELAAKNGISVTDDIDAGCELETVAVANAATANYYRNNDIKPATAAGGDSSGNGGGTGGYADEGIEFWYVGFDFQAS
ncbi:MAG: hypothetical protein LBG92_03070 [Prevotellaceae bacterium]|jgi:hypothetical protein|nr:hypothetical protein [Prevotellaceae bacterium]